MAGIPLLLWAVSGLIMASRPLAEVRSTTYLGDPHVAPGLFVAPRIDRQDIRAVELVTGPAGPRWRFAFDDGSMAALDARTGATVDRVTAAQAAAAANGAYKKSSSIASVSFVDRAHRPHEFRTPVDSWRVAYADGMRIYVDAWSGQVLIARSRWWSIYDAAWAVHIMDIQGRDDPNNPWIIMLGLLTAAMTLFALTLLPKATRKMLGVTGPTGEI